MLSLTCSVSCTNAEPPRLFGSLSTPIRQDPGMPWWVLHGITGHAEAYFRNLGFHGEHFSCWAIDFIGHG